MMLLDVKYNIMMLYLKFKLIMNHPK